MEVYQKSTISVQKFQEIHMKPCSQALLELLLEPTHRKIGCHFPCKHASQKTQQDKQCGPLQKTFIQAAAQVNSQKAETIKSLKCGKTDRNRKFFRILSQTCKQGVGGQGRRCKWKDQQMRRSAPQGCSAVAKLFRRHLHLFYRFDHCQSLTHSLCHCKSECT